MKMNPVNSIGIGIIIISRAIEGQGHSDILESSYVLAILKWTAPTFSHLLEY